MGKTTERFCNGYNTKPGNTFFSAGNKDFLLVFYNLYRKISVFFVFILSFFTLAFCLPAEESRWLEIDGTLHLKSGRDAWVEIEGVTYGAKPDERGPVGGGEGYGNIITGGDFIVTDLDSLLDALSRAKKGQVVYIPGETEIDLTTRIYIEKLVLEVPAGVTLAGERGNKGSKGALLKSDTQSTWEMIRIMGNDVRITGLRIQGPNPKRRIEHHGKAFGDGGGGHEYYYKFPAQRGISVPYGTDIYHRLEVDNCDISGFGHAGIFLAYGEGHHIHHNFIHHCQYQGLGYGICLDIASALIEFNIFDWNRHSIAGTGRPGCSYTARHNIQLGTSLSHDFDMHGGSNRGDDTEIAGTSIEIYNNTFLSRETPVVISGVPEEKSDIYRNWFVRRSGPKAAIIAGYDIYDKMLYNVYGRNPSEAK